MHKIHEQRLRLNRVTAVFEDRALSFILTKDATLEELSDRLADLGRHNGCPAAVTVEFGASNLARRRSHQIVLGHQSLERTHALSWEQHRSRHS